jgi:hypothetical protein
MSDAMFLLGMVPFVGALYVGFFSNHPRALEISWCLPGASAIPFFIGVAKL